MQLINELPYYEIEFSADGALVAGSDNRAIADAAAAGVTDLFVLSHGWNNSADSARTLYSRMFSMIAGQIGDQRRTSAAVGVFWPSLLFPDDAPDPASSAPSTGAQLAASLTSSLPAHADQLKAMGELLDLRPQQPDKLVEFHTLARSLVTTSPQGEEDSGESAILTGDTVEVLGHAAAMAPRALVHAEGIGNPFESLWRGARELLRTLSYFEMKNRAGVIGQYGLGPLVNSLSGPAGQPRIHLIGHSFGARLVSYALTALPANQPSPVKSLTLIQGAFSHFAFARSLPFEPGRGGALAEFYPRVDGPLLATFSAADRAVGWWYPAASMLARQDSQSAQELAFRWGAMGHDGFQQGPAATVLPIKAAGSQYPFQRGTFYALDANAVINDVSQSDFSGAHSDIHHPEVAWAIASASGLV